MEDESLKADMKQIKSTMDLLKAPMALGSWVDNYKMLPVIPPSTVDLPPAFVTSKKLEAKNLYEEYVAKFEAGKAQMTG